MFDLNAPIVPGQSAAGVALGQPVEEILKENKPISVHAIANPWLSEEEPRSTRYHFKHVDLWVKEGRVDQIGVYGGYRGAIQSQIGIGSTIAEVQAAFGQVVEDEDDDLVVAGMGGWTFETSQWKRSRDFMDNLDAPITEIFVFLNDMRRA